MYNMEIWKLATDILLAGALVYLAFRILNRPAHDTSTLEMQSLEQSLRSVVQEADQSSRTLGAELLKRKQDLEKLLFDLGTVEHRINRAINTAEERKGALELECSRASQLENEIHLKRREPVKAAEQAQPVAPVVTLSNAVERTVVASQALVEEASILAPEPPSFEIAVSRQAAQVRPGGRTSSTAYNIYGDLIGAPGGSSSTEVGNLAARVEKEIEMPRQSERGTSVVVEDIFNAAEEMIRSGQDLRVIAQRTDLPLEDLQMLSQVVKREQAMSGAKMAPEATPPVEEEIAVIDSATAFSRTDQRLGVLGGIKRQVQVL